MEETLSLLILWPLVFTGFDSGFKYVGPYILKQCYLKINNVEFTKIHARNYIWNAFYLFILMSINVVSFDAD